MTSSSRNENAGAAFGLVLAASASTSLGAAVVFFLKLVKMANRRVLAMTLGFSAGVMTFVSFAEIFGKATNSFIDDGHDENRAYIYATCCFFVGVLFMMLLNVAVHTLFGGRDHHHEKHHDGRFDPVNQLETAQRMADVLEQEEQQSHDHAQELDELESDTDDYNNDDDDNDDNVIPVRQNNSQKNNRMDEDEARSSDDYYNKNESQDSSCTSAPPGERPKADECDIAAMQQLEHIKPKQDDKTEATNSDMFDENSETNNKKLERMGLNTAIALGLHNFPEGLATFVAALEDPAVGAVLAVAIAIHNIPEGLCVALPVYYATGNRCKAFLWGAISGASDIVAALLGWLILVNVIGDTTYAIFFGLVSGMMVIISMKELLPMAHHYDPKDTVVTYSFIAGMALMAFSLIMFLI
ncbi:ZIP zinc transporter [Nitzschia inconspicua]|uniref:ZIP zinc transporter n=1 Tax=Nitzschia inconspicua TaxID=303405 RepID=A0A9K3Q240_9STRA|nr:ZIP zinc transporter [Nitzschia inconspicua]